MTDHGFNKWEYSTRLSDLEKTAQYLSEQPHVASSHVVKSKEGDAIIYLARSVSTKTSAHTEALVKEKFPGISMPLRTKVFRIHSSYKEGDKIHPGQCPHFFECLNDCCNPKSAWRKP